MNVKCSQSIDYRFFKTGKHTSVSEENVILVRFQGLNCLEELFKVRGVLISGVSLERGSTVVLRQTT